MHCIRMSLLLFHGTEMATWMHNFVAGSSWVSILRELKCHSSGYLLTVKLLDKSVFSAKFLVQPREVFRPNTIVIDHLLL